MVIPYFSEFFMKPFDWLIFNKKKPHLVSGGNNRWCWGSEEDKNRNSCFAMLLPVDIFNKLDAKATCLNCKIYNSRNEAISDFEQAYKKARKPNMESWYSEKMWKVILGCLILASGIILCYTVQVFPRQLMEKPKNLTVLKATKEGIFVENTYNSYKLYTVELPDGTWYVVAVPKK